VHSPFLIASKINLGVCLVGRVGSGEEVLGPCRGARIE